MSNPFIPLLAAYVIAKKAGPGALGDFDGQQDASELMQLFQLALTHEQMEGDTAQENALIEWGQTHGLVAAQAMKAFEANKCMPIAKAWTGDLGETHIEGWISRENPDIERDVVSPEAFTDAVDGYMALGAPLTSEHQLKPTAQMLTRYPIGHMQRVALVRDGQVFKAGQHPTDPADFTAFPATGTGVYGVGVIDDPLAASQVAKGNVRGFSWVGMVTTYTRLPSGGRKFLSVIPWRETTIAAFPMNPTAVITAAS